MRSIKPILLALTLTLPAIAQTPTLKVYSRETIVDVTVTDAKGNPVHGLKKEDFTLKEDNKPQPIRSFEEFGHASPSAPPPKLPPNVYTNLQQPAPDNAIDLLWLDFRSVPLKYQPFVKQQAFKYLHDMPQGTRVAVLGSSGLASLHLLQGITSDPALLKATIETLPFDTTSTPEPGESFQAWCSRWELLNEMTLESMNQIAADLAGIKGRKNLIWFMKGFPAITDPAQRPDCLTDYAPKLKTAYGLLAASQVTVFPIDGRGLPLSGAPPKDLLSMEAIAEATGGVAFYNNNDLVAGISKAVATGSDFYTLSYVPPGAKYDGRHHTITLKTTQPGLHLTYRNEYYAEDPTKMTPPVGLTLTATPPKAHAGNMQAAMSRSIPTSTDLLFDVQVEPVSAPPQPGDPPIFGALDAKLAAEAAKKPDLLTRYGFEYALPGRQLIFVPTPDGKLMKASLEFDLAAYDADGKLITSLSQSIQPTLTPEHHQQLLKGPFRFFQQLDLPAGALFLRIGILDATSNKAGTLEIPLTVLKNVVIKDMPNPPALHFDTPKSGAP